MTMFSSGDARRLMESQQELTLLKWMNRVEYKVLVAISDGKNFCDIERIPEWVANNIKLQHPDWDVLYTLDKTHISW